MNLLAKFGLSDAEQKVIKKVLQYSITGCVVVVLGAWSIGHYRAKQERLRHVAQGLTDYSRNEILPLDLDAHAFVAQHYMAMDQPESAIPFLQRILPFRRDRAARSLLAQAYLEAGYYDKAREEFVILNDEGVQDSLSPKIAARLGISLFYLGKIDASMDALNRCLAKYPRNPEAACFMGQIEASQSTDTTQALTYLHQAVQWDSSYVEGWYQLGRYYMDKNNYPEARINLVRALEINPLHVKSRSRLGMVYYYMHDFDLAKQSYQTALALNPHDYNTRYNLGELYFSVFNDQKSALEEFKLALFDNPQHVDANFKAGIICLCNNMDKEAIRYFNAALSSEPHSIRILMQLGVAFEKLGDNQNALQTYKTVASIDPLNISAAEKIKLLSH